MAKAPETEEVDLALLIEKVLKDTTTARLAKEDETKLGDRRLGDLTVSEFSKVFISLLDTRQYLHAEKEAEVSKRIFANADILAATTPFEVRTLDDLNKMGKMMADVLRRNGGAGGFMVAVATVPQNDPKNPGGAGGGGLGW